MKKSFFISIIALSGAVHAATALTFDQFSDTLKAGLVYANDFNDNGGNLVDGGISFDRNFALSDGTAILGTNNGDVRPYISSGIAGTSFTVSFDVTDLSSASKWNTLAAFYSDNATYQYQHSLVFMIGDNSSDLVLASPNGGSTAFGPDGTSNSINATTGITVGNANSETLTIVQNAVTQTISLYNNGSLILSVDDWDCSALTGAQFGAAFSNTQTISSAAIDNLAIWDRALTSAEVATLTGASVPEPATATLSLLALGALALRRRRA